MDRKTLALLAASVSLLLGSTVIATCHAEEGAKVDLRAVTGQTLAWNRPTMRTDGGAFDIVAENGYYNVTWTRGQETGTIRVAKEATSASIQQFKANTQFTIVACDDLDICSVPSNMVKKPGGPPLAPTAEITP